MNEILTQKEAAEIRERIIDYSIAPHTRRPTPTQYIVALARTFPCLESKLRGWTPAEFDADKFHERIGPWSHGERLCALFVLNVWNPGYAKQQGWEFDLIEFIGIADRRNLSALTRWMQDPYWP